MSFRQIFKRVLVPCAAGLAADRHSHGPNCVKQTQETKPSKLPIYSNECCICRNAPKKQEPPNPVEECVGNIRRELWVWQDNMRGYRHKFVDVYNDSFQQVECSGGVVPEKCVARDHLKQSLDDSCYPILPCPEGPKPPKTKEVSDTRCSKPPPWPLGRKPKKPCVERCIPKPPPPKEDDHCCCCRHQTTPPEEPEPHKCGGH